MALLAVVVSPALAGLAGGAAASASTARSSTSGATFYVAPGGVARSCSANSSASPFSTIQAALACARGGDVVKLAPTSGSAPYPGIGTVPVNVTIEAGPGGSARTVRVDVSPGRGPLAVAAGVSVTVQGVTLDCVSGHGQAQLCGPDVTNNGTLVLRSDTVTGSNAQGIVNDSTNAGSARLTVIASTITGNNDYVGGLGGGISSGFGPGTTTVMYPSVTVANSTIAGNGVNDGDVIQGGGIYVGAGSVTLINDTISGNQAQAGGGIYAQSEGTTVLLSGTLVAGNTAFGPGPDCQGVFSDGPGGHNLIGSASGCSGLTDGVNGDQVGVASPGLGKLANNGGPTNTIALQAASPAIEAASPPSARAAPSPILTSAANPATPPPAAATSAPTTPAGLLSPLHEPGQRVHLGRLADHGVGRHPFRSPRRRRRVAAADRTSCRFSRRGGAGAAAGCELQRLGLARR